MTRSDYTGYSEDALLQTYSIAASEHGKCGISGDYTNANKQHDVVAAVYRELRSRGINAQRRSLELLNHHDISVRSWAAAHALEFAPVEGENVLNDIAATNRGIPGFVAQTTLLEWRKGKLKFP